MHRIFAVTGLQFRLVFKSGANLFMLLLMPLVLTLIFGVMVGGGEESPGQGRIYPVAVVDADGSLGSELLVTALQNQAVLNVRVAARASLSKLFADKQIAAGILIPPGFELSLREQRAPELQLLSSPDANIALAIAPAVQREASRVSSDYRLAVAVTSASENGASDNGAIRSAYEQVRSERAAQSILIARETLRRADTPAQTGGHTAVTYASVGFTVMFVMMLVFMQGGVILQERQNGTWGRLLTTPTTRLSLLIGYLISFFLIGMTQFSLLIGATRLLFGVSWGPWLPLMGMAAAFVLCSSALGLFVAGLVRTAEQQRTFGAIAVVASSMLGGVYWPLEMVGETMQRIGYLTPQAWAMMGFTEVMLRGGSFGGLLWPIAVLLSLTVIFMTAGLLRVKYES